MSTAADELRAFFKRLADLSPTGESRFLSNTEAVLRERDELIVTLQQVAKWCHAGHGTFPAKGCGLCGPVLRAIGAVPE